MEAQQCWCLGRTRHWFSQICFYTVNACVCTCELMSMCTCVCVIAHVGLNDTSQAHHSHWRNQVLLPCKGDIHVQETTARLTNWSEWRGKPSGNPQGLVWEELWTVIITKAEKNNNSPSWRPGCKWLIYSGKRNGVLMTNCNAAQQAWLCAVNYFERGSMP